jgi:hypothetical protein
LDDDDKRAAKKAKKQAMNTESLIKLREFCQNQLEGCQDDQSSELAQSNKKTTSSPHSLNTRSVEDLKKMYRKSFLKLSTGKGTCEHCGAVTKTIVHYRSRLVIIFEVHTEPFLG